MLTRDLIVALRRHYRRMNVPWVVLREAFGIDVLALSQSGGGGNLPPHRRIAHELKVSRSDFRKELNAWPHKATAGLDMAHAYVLVTPAGLLSDAERKRREPPGPRETDAPISGVPKGMRDALWIPAGVGLMEVDEDGVCRMRVRPAWHYEARAWTSREVAYLAAYAHRPGVIERAEWRQKEADYQLVHINNAREALTEESERVQKVMAGIAPLHVREGQRWRVPGDNAPSLPVYGPENARWSERGGGEWVRQVMPLRKWSSEPVDCEVVEIVPSAHWEATARLRRLDTGHEHEEGKLSGPRLSWLLMNAERIEQDTPATVTSLAERRR